MRGKASCDPFRGVTVTVERRCGGRGPRLRERGGGLARIRRVDQRVRAEVNGVDPFRARPKRDARDAEPVRLLLQSARVGDDTRSACGECEHLEVAERRDRLEGRAELDAVLVEYMARPRVN